MDTRTYTILERVDTLFKKASSLYNNTKSEGFYVSTQDIDGLHIGIYKPMVATNLWVNYVPEDTEDAEIVVKSESLKVFYCDNCPILEPTNVMKVEKCIGKGT